MYTLKRNIRRDFFSIFLLSGIVFLQIFFLSVPRALAQETVLSEEALVDLVKPSVVRIAEHVTGTAKVPAIVVDIRKRLVATIPDKFTEVTVDEYLSGSGFVISPDGYVATNAHVVSLETVKLTLASESALSAIFENALFLSDEEMKSFLEEEDGKGFSKDVVQYVIDHSEFHLSNQVAVLRPDSKETRIGALLKEGFPAEVVSVNDRFIDNERDVALLKIEESDLPAITLGNSEELNVGKKAYIFGFPATAEVNPNNPSEATFTQGVVSAIKQSGDKSFKIFQTDAKVSQGSSGGPLFNERGEVVGIITFQTTELNRTTGDNFAFALPIDLVKQAAADIRVLPREGAYGENFKKGFEAYTEKYCDKALEFFEKAKKTYPAFQAENYLSAYITKCEELKLQGESQDTYWERFQGGARNLSDPLLYIVGAGLFMFGIFGAAIFWLLRQVRREEKEIAVLEKRLLADEIRHMHYGKEAIKKPPHTKEGQSYPKQKRV